jgi:hypothetical protein
LEVHLRKNGMVEGSPPQNISKRNLKVDILGCPMNPSQKSKDPLYGGSSR